MTNETDQPVATPPHELAPDRPRARIELALQGGGAHGAFTWGVLERLLEDESIDVGRVSGTSAGALNGAALVSGYATAGRSGAIDNLGRLWRRAAEAGAPMTLLHVPLKKPGLGIWDDALPLLSPYQTNSFGLEPLRFILSGVADIDAMRAQLLPALYVNAINVHTGFPRVFGPERLSVEALMASACAPMMFQAVDIDGEFYWDGSYGGNPMLWPLYQDGREVDILLVELSPLRRSETPTTAKNILNRINEIASINGLVAELREIQSVNAAAKREVVRVHVISLPESLSVEEVEPSTKRTVDAVMFERLRAHGREACDMWLRTHRSQLGVASSVDIDSRFLAAHHRDFETQLVTA